MAGNLLNQYGTNNQTITCTFNSLTNNSARASTVIDNTSNLWVDALVQLIISSPTASTSATGYLVVYAYGTANNGSNYSDSATGSDAGITLTVPPNVRPIGLINVVANSTVYNAGPFSVAAAFGGVLPQKWGIIIENKTGGTMNSSGNSSFYQGVAGSYT